MTQPYQPGQPVIPGPAPTGPYEYIVVPLPKPRLPNDPLTFGYGPYQQIEQELNIRRMPADRIDRSDGVRCYRVLVQYLWKALHDPIGPFLFKPPQTQYRFQLDDPMIGYANTDEWEPIW